MSKYYTGKRAQHYNIRWHTFTARTLEETRAMVDFAALRSVQERFGRYPRVLDVACGTGNLLKQFLAVMPNIEAYGVDASADMLVQARMALKDQQHVHLELSQIGTSETANLPYAQETFDLITCTNALHDIPEPAGTLEGLRGLLAPGGQLVLEDFAPRRPRFLWAAFEWLLQRIEGNVVHAYTVAKAKVLCQQAGLHVSREKEFTVNWLWRGWVVCTYRTDSETRSK